MSDHTLSIKDSSSPLMTDACSIILIALFKFKKSCWIPYFSLKYAILFPKIEFALYPVKRMGNNNPPCLTPFVNKKYGDLKTPHVTHYFCPM